jgi:hypothetical protein
MVIYSTPVSYASVHDDLIYTVYDPHSTDPINYPNYKYIGDVYVGSVMVARIKKVQDPTTDVGIFNIGQIVRNYLSLQFNPTANVLIAQQIGDGSFRVQVTMKFGEEYLYTSYYNLLSDSPRIFFNNYNGRLVGALTSLLSKTDKLASDCSLSGQTSLSNNYSFIPYFPTTTSPVSALVTPTGGGSAFTSVFTPANALDLQVLNISPGALNAVHAGAITATTTSYTVAIGAQVYYMKVICEPIYESFTIHFLNKYSGFETKIFNKVSRRTIDITKKDFGKLPYTVDSGGQVSYRNSNGVYNESRSVYASQYVEKLALNSDFITDAEYKWLEDLVLSPMVYIEDSGYFFPCLITDTTYELKKNVNDDLTNLAISIEYGRTLNAQFR